MKFMQKYYHEGVFFRDNTIVDNNTLEKHDFLQPTGKDSYINYELVPEPMKRKNFGLMSQTKWTHLAQEDTTLKKDKDDWKFRAQYHANEKVIRRGGQGDFDRPSEKNLFKSSSKHHYKYNHNQNYKNKDNDQYNDREKDRYIDKERDQNKHRHHDNYKDNEKNRDRERERDRDRDKDKDRERSNHIKNHRDNRDDRDQHRIKR